MADDLATALASRKLGEDEGKEVWASAIEIPGAAGGLRDALAVEPVVLHYDEVVHVVLRCTVRKLRHEPLRDTNALRRVHILSVEEATLVEGSVVADALANMADKIRLAKEAAVGVQRLPTDGPDAGDPDEADPVADPDGGDVEPTSGEWEWDKADGPDPALAPGAEAVAPGAPTAEAPAAEASVTPLGRGRKGRGAAGGAAT